MRIQTRCASITLRSEIDSFLLEQEDLLAVLPPHHKEALR